MNISQLVELAEVAVSHKRGLALNHLQKVILQECCQHETKTYEQIASDHSYSPSYLKKKAIPLLWKTLSDTFEEKVTKANCRSVLEKNVTDLDNFSAPEVALERPDGPVPLGSPFYIPRVRWERLGCEELLEPGGLLCLQGTSKVGKTSLLVRLLDRLETHGYRTVRLSLNRASTTVLSSVETFARWLCANITQQVDAEIRLQKFWHEEVGDLTNCSLYLQQYLLDRSPIPIVLAIDEFDRLFDRPTIADDFICLLRSWYEEAKDCRAWQKLRIVLVYSTESHLLLKTGKSPVNIGLTLDVPPLDTAQVRALAARHRFYLSASDVDRLQSVLGGFPDLVRQVFYHAVRSHRSPIELLSGLASDTGILRDRLHEKLHWLNTHPDLLAAYQKVISSDSPLILEPQIAFQLYSLGLVRRHDKAVTASCQLYRQYFRERLR